MKSVAPLHEALGLASNPNTAPTLLLELVAYPAKAVRQLIASNPSTPMNGLFMLLSECPGEVEGNAAFQLHLLSNPRLLLEAPDELRRGWAQRNSSPGWLLEQFATFDEEPDIVEDAIKTCSDPEILARIALSEDETVREHVASNLDCPPSLMERLASDKFFDVRAAVFANPRCPATILSRVFDEKDAILRSQIARMKDSPARLEALASDRNVYVRVAVARNPRSPGALLRSLASDEDYRVRVVVADNPSCPPELREALTSDGDSRVREVASQPPEG